MGLGEGLALSHTAWRSQPLIPCPRQRMGVQQWKEGRKNWPVWSYRSQRRGRPGWQNSNSAPPRGWGGGQKELRGPARSRSSCCINPSPLLRCWATPGSWSRSQPPQPQKGRGSHLLPSPPGTQTHSGPLVSCLHMSLGYLLSIFHASSRSKPMKYEWIEVLTSK